MISNGSRPSVSGAAVLTEEPANKDLAVAEVDLLAHFWSRPIDCELALWRESVEEEAAVWRRLGGSAKVFSVKDSDALLEEYERLFVGPGPVPCPPYESYWREDVPVDIRRSLMGPCTEVLKDRYRMLGLEFNAGCGELPDHLAVELEALAVAVDSEQFHPVARLLFGDHLRKWVPRLCRAVAHETDEPFYRQLAEVTLGWLGAFEGYLHAIAPPSSGE